MILVLLVQSNRRGVGPQVGYYKSRNERTPVWQLAMVMKMAPSDISVTRCIFCTIREWSESIRVGSSSDLLMRCLYLAPGGYAPDHWLHPNDCFAFTPIFSFRQEANGENLSHA